MSGFKCRRQRDGILVPREIVMRLIQPSKEEVASWYRTLSTDNSMHFLRTEMFGICFGDMLTKLLSFRNVEYPYCILQDNVKVCNIPWLCLGMSYHWFNLEDRNDNGPKGLY
jgi:hypothetical protein